MALTFGDARKLLALYADRGGKCSTSEDVRLFVLEVLQYMLYSGQYGSLRTYTFNAVSGCITLPYELEVPLKLKINGNIGSVWTMWYEYSSSPILEGAGCHDAGDALIEDPNTYPTVYDIPDSGALVGVQADCAQEADAHVIVAGIDIYGKEVFTYHKGEKISGEYLTIKKGALNYTQTIFKEIRSVNKTETNGYVSLWWVAPAYDIKGFLAEYSPYEKVPAYRRARLSIKCDNYARVVILGKIRLKDYYADTDRIPFDNIVALKTAAQARNANSNDDNATAQFKDQYLLDVINRENMFKKSNVGQPLEVYAPTSASRIRGIINSKPRMFGFGGFGRR